MNYLNKNNAGYFLKTPLLISEVATGYKALHITDSSDLTLSTRTETNTVRDGAEWYQRETERWLKTEQRNERRTFIEVSQTAANYTEKQTHTHILFFFLRQGLVRLVMEK